jgi:hypothetical protein
MKVLSGIALLVLLSTSARAQQLLQTYTGSVGDEFGAALLPISDQNTDGVPDLLVGAPGFNGGRGYVRCLSGRFMINGTGPSVVWTLMPNVNAGARFGSSLAQVGDLNSDIWVDFAVGAPGFSAGSNGIVNGAVFLIDGSTHVEATRIVGDPNTRFGTSLAALGDQDGDTEGELAVTGPSTNGSPSWVYVIFGSSFFTSTDLSGVLHSGLNANSSPLYAATVASGFDFDGDGLSELAIGSPDFLGNGGVDVWRPPSATHAWMFFASFGGQFAGERMGASIDGNHDYNGDGVPDLVVGAPNWHGSTNTEDGRAVVLSGATFVTAPGPAVLYELKFNAGPAPTSNHFGARVRASDDLNHDGVGDFIVATPDYHTTLPFGPGKGAAIVYSGATGMRIGSVIGPNNDHLGDSLVGAFLDFDLDGFRDFVVGASLSDINTTDCGAVRLYSLFPSSWSTYCTAKTNSLGCVPAIGASGTMSASSLSPFVITCANVINHTSGLFFYSHHPVAAPFQGGTLCVDTPFQRLSVLNSAGNAGAPDCSGSFGYDFGAYRASGVDPTLSAGAEVFGQCWSRDPQSPSTTNLSNGVRFVINP